MKRITRIDTTGMALWASAFVLAGLVIVQAGRLPSNPAYGEMAGVKDPYVMMTTDSGKGGNPPYELLYLIDSRDQVLLVYEIENAQKKQILLRDGGPLEQLFNGARR